MSWRGSRVRAGLLLIALAVAPVWHGVVTAQQPPRAAQDEFVPIDQLPPDEKLPAARLLIAAYSVAWVLVAAYLWSIWQRLGRVEREMADVTRRMQRGPGSGAPADGGSRGRP